MSNFHESDAPAGAAGIIGGALFAFLHSFDEVMKSWKRRWSADYRSARCP